MTHNNITKRRRTVPAALAVAAGWLAVAGLDLGCNTARRGLPVAEPVAVDDAQLISGRELFMASCHQCHPGGEAGLGPAINNKPLPGAAMRTQIRLGVGAMPGFGEDRLSDEEVDDIVAYLNYLQWLGAPNTEAAR